MSDLSVCAYYHAAGNDPCVTISAVLRAVVSPTSHSPNGRSPATTITFSNDTPFAVSINWIAFDGAKTQYAFLTPGTNYTQSTYIGHVWLLERIGQNQQMKKKGAICSTGTCWFTKQSMYSKHSPTSYIGCCDPTRVEAIMFDRREITKSGANRSGWISPPNVIEFDCLFGGTFERPTAVVKFQFNPEYSVEEAGRLVEQYAPEIGKMPGFLFKRLKSLWVHKGLELLGGGNDNILLYPEMAEREYKVLLVEAFIHEATHCSFDPDHLHSKAWQDCVDADSHAVSPYAAEHRYREDIAELMAPYLAMKYCPYLLGSGVAEQMRSGLAARIQYLDDLQLTMDILR